MKTFFKALTTALALVSRSQTVAEKKSVEVDIYGNGITAHQDTINADKERLNPELTKILTPGTDLYTNPYANLHKLPVDPYNSLPVDPYNSLPVKNTEKSPQTSLRGSAAEQLHNENDQYKAK